MAEASDPGLEELEKEVTCSICKEHFSHLYYCKDCIQQLRLTAPLYLSMLCPTTPCMGYGEARWGFEISVASLYEAYPRINPLAEAGRITGDLTHAV